MDATPSYSPDIGKLLPVGRQSLTVTFTPRDSTKYSTTSKTVYLIVNPSHLATALSARPYDLTGTRRTEFLEQLRPPTGANTLRIGCLEWSEHACVSAGQFLVLFSEAGWKIDQNKVFRLENPIPQEGVSIVSLPEPGPAQPPHLGRWHKGDLTEATLCLGFMKMGLRPYGSSDPSLGSAITGVYFGPEPASLSVVEKREVQALQIVKFVYEGNAIGTLPGEESKWDTEVQSWLKTNFGESASDKFRECLGIEKRKKFLISLGQKLHPPAEQ